MSDDAAQLPKRWPWLVAWFRWYAKGYVRKHFHAVHLSRAGGRPPQIDGPIIVAVNHPSWWDPLIGIVIADLFPKRTHYIPIDAAQLNQYRMFRRLGFYGVEPHSMRGAVQFLRTSKAILDQPNTMIWVTVQGEFRDVRTRPLEVRPGIGFLAAKLEQATILPLVLEYAFWTERTPEAFARFGEPLATCAELDGRGWTARIENALTNAQDALSTEVMSRDVRHFEPLLIGRSGVGGIYDRWRRTRAWLTGQSFQAEHGERKS